MSDKPLTEQEVRELVTEANRTHSHRSGEHAACLSCRLTAALEAVGEDWLLELKDWKWKYDAVKERLAEAEKQKQHNYESAVGWRDRCLKAERERDEYQAWYELRDAERVRLQARLAEARAALEREVACRRWAYAQIRMWWKGVHRGGSAEAAVRELDREEKVLDEALKAMDNPDA